MFMFYRWLQLATVVSVWGMSFANTRSLLVDFSPLEILWLRFALAWAVLVPVGMVQKRLDALMPVERTLKNEILYVAMGITGVAAYQFLENCAIKYSNASNVAILVSFGPIVTAFMVRAFTRNGHFSVRLLIGSAVAVVGVALVSLRGCVEVVSCPIGDTMAFCAMLCWGLYSVLLDKVNAMGICPVVEMRKSFCYAVVLMFPVVVYGMTEQGHSVLDGLIRVTIDAEVNRARFSKPSVWGNIMILGIFASALCFVFWSSACRVFGVVRTTVSMYLTPIVGALFSVLFLGERLTPLSIVGGCVILTGVVFATLKGNVSRAIQWLNTSYGVWYKLKHGGLSVRKPKQSRDPGAAATRSPSAAAQKRHCGRAQRQESFDRSRLSRLSRQQRRACP